MKKPVLSLLLAAAMLLTLAACGEEPRIVHCDRCGVEIEVEADSNITGEWILFCGDCNVDLYGEDGLVLPGN